LRDEIVYSMLLKAE